MKSIKSAAIIAIIVLFYGIIPAVKPILAAGDSSISVSASDIAGQLGYACPKGTTAYIKKMTDNLKKHPEQRIICLVSTNDCTYVDKKDCPNCANQYEADGTLIGCGVPPIKTGLTSYGINVKIPCQSILGGKCIPDPKTPAELVNNFYIFALMIAGFLAFGSIVFGGLQYVLSAGNFVNQQDAKDRITQAILGLLLLFSAYFILGTINPKLTRLKTPAVEPLNIEALEPPETEPGTQSQLPTETTIEHCLQSILINVPIIISGTQETTNVFTGTSSIESFREDLGPHIEKCIKCDEGYKLEEGKCVTQ